MALIGAALFSSNHHVSLGGKVERATNNPLVEIVIAWISSETIFRALWSSSC